MTRRVSDCLTSSAAAADHGPTDLIGELSTRSEESRTWLASHDVRLPRTSTKMMHHPDAGALELAGERFDTRWRGVGDVRETTRA